MPKIVDADKNRYEIARFACKAISEKGIRRVTMIDIAKAAGVTTGMLANYFATKDDIIVAALRVSFKNIEACIVKKINQNETNLASILKASIPLDKDSIRDTKVWVAFWGLIATDDKFRKLNIKLHNEGTSIYNNAVKAAWLESSNWSEDTFNLAVRSVITVVFGLCVGGVTNPNIWTKSLMEKQLSNLLEDIRRWANKQ